MKASPPSFRELKSNMQNLAPPSLGHIVELFCPHRKGYPEGEYHLDQGWRGFEEKGEKKWAVNSRNKIKWTVDY